MARKSNKTAHVLNLLAGGQVDSEQSEQKEPEQKKKAPSNISLIDPASISDPLSSLIRETLDKEVIQSDGNVSNGDSSTVEESGKPTNEADISPEITAAATVPPDTNDPPENSDQQLSNLLPDEASENANTDNTDRQQRDTTADESLVTPVIPDVLKKKTDDQAQDLVNDAVSPEIEDTLTEVIQSQLIDEETPIIIEESLPMAEKTVTEIPETVNAVQEETTIEGQEFVSSPEIAAQTDESNFQMTVEGTEKELSNTVVEDKDDSPKEIVAPAVSVPPALDISDQEPAADIIPDNTTTEEAEPEIEYRYVNMMDIIVEERLLEFMHRFNVCTCKRCVADTKALALNNLPPKYIVAPVASFSPLLSFYRNKFNIYVITELTKACLVVLDQPRH